MKAPADATSRYLQTTIMKLSYMEKVLVTYALKSSTILIISMFLHSGNSEHLIKGNEQSLIILLFLQIIYTYFLCDNQMCG